MLAKIKDYLLLASIILSAVLYYLFARRGQKIKDIEADVIKEKLDNKLKEINTITNKSKDEYEKSLDNYRRLRNLYNKRYRE